MQTSARRGRRLVMAGPLLCVRAALIAPVTEAQELNAANSDSRQKISFDLSPRPDSAAADPRFRQLDSPFAVEADWFRPSPFIDVTARTLTAVQSTAKPLPRSRRSTIARRVLFGIAGSVVGYFAGGLVGAGLDQNCNGCDSPHLAGFVIGSSIGCPIGATVGVLLAR